MKKIIFILLLIPVTNINAQIMETLEKITWYGQAAVKIDNNGQTIIIDPFHIPSEEEADIVLITHSHGDHLSPEDISMVATEKTKFVCPEDCREALTAAGYNNISTVKPGDEITIDGLKILAVPMYNIVKTNFHPKENNWTGFILDIDGVKIYHAGDTERIPEMKDVVCDIVMLPLGQTYTMNNVEEAAQAAIDTGAKVAIPIHFGLYEGTQDDALKFKELLKDRMDVVILGRE
ncbi:MAG TPA: MBL fold metallo-hydrolase [Bacteroidales bacterium]|nr:MBL fold metallo-hydrolase [Bacteroidales bacterium]